jgi:serine/threonine protein kinase/Tol biopolymer transport system component
MSASPLISSGSHRIQFGEPSQRLEVLSLKCLFPFYNPFAMTLTNGTRLGPYEIESPLGAGGMGEVYRARDTRLDRIVAIKILPAQFSADPLRKQRFEREAKTVSSLNHPHICVLYDVGSQDGLDYLVMECVEGETLAKRLVKGPLPLEQVLKYGAQMADALDKAHRGGVVHRDLKPGNIMLTPTGAKLLDFGLAKPVAPLAGVATLTAAVTQSSPMTEQGGIVGTFQYMSPEQVEGKELDGRSDIFSLGAVLYEMLTGQRAFQGRSQLSVASAILEKEPPPIIAARPLTPPALDYAIRKCLAKLPDERWQSSSDLASELKWIVEAGSQAGALAPAVTHSKARERLAWITAAVLAIALALVLVFLSRGSRPVPASLTRFSADLGQEVIGTPWASGLAISPDASRLVFVSRSPDQTQRLFLHVLDSATATPVSGTENAQGPFFSPDGQWVAFFADGKLKKIAVLGGVPATLCDAPSTRGGSWGEDGNIILAPSSRSPLVRVSSAGGNPQPVTELKGEWTHRYPQVLPRTKAFLFTSCQTLDLETCAIEVQSVSSPQRRVLVRGGYSGRYLASGHLLYMHQGALFAAPMNLKRLELTGAASPVLEDVSSNVGTAVAQFDFSRTGTLVYIPGKASPPTRSIFWLDVAGSLTPLGLTPRAYRAVRVSPDGTRLALVIAEASQTNVWVYEWARDRLSRLTFLDGNSEDPVWTPDGKHLVFSSDTRAPGPGIYWIRTDGAGEAQRLFEGANLGPRAFSPDGKWLAYDSQDVGTGVGSWTLPVTGTDSDRPKAGKPEALGGLAGLARFVEFSPDGRWIAYITGKSGLPEMYVQSFPGPGGQWLVSSEGIGGAVGGFNAYWSLNGRELFYTDSEGQIIALNYTAKEGTFSASPPRLWSPRHVGRAIGYSGQSMDLAPDGKRFAVILPTGQDAEPKPQTHVVFLLNFFDELRRKVPTGNN